MDCPIDKEIVMSSSKHEVQTLLTGRVFVESPRWHEGRLWFSDWLTRNHRRRSQRNKRSDMPGANIPVLYGLATRWTPPCDLWNRGPTRTIRRFPGTTRRLGQSLQEGFERDCCGRARKCLRQRCRF